MEICWINWVDLFEVKMKKIMLISSKDNNFYNFRSEMILKLLELKYKVVLVCPYGKKIDYFTEHGCEFIDLDMDRRGTSIFNDLKLMNNYKKILKSEQPDLVLTYTAKPSYYASFVCQFLHIPHIINNAGIMETGKLLTKLLDFLYKICERKADCIMFQNSYERDYTEKLLKNKVHYRDIPGSGVNTDAFPYQPYPLTDEVVTFNYVARVMKSKGIEEFLECAKFIRKKYPFTKFVIYGDFDDDTYRPIVKEYIDSDIVEYGGILMDIKPAIAKAHAVIHPSYYEGMTNVVLEHSSSGRPCIGSNVPGVKDGIDDGKTGFVFEVKNSQSLIEYVEKFLALSHEEKEEMGRQAREKMKKEFERSIVTNIYVEEIKKILGE